MSKIRTRLARMIILGFKQFQDPYYQGFAAQISFYLMLSIVPLLLLITQILGFFGISLESVLALIEDYTGKEMTGMIRSLFEFSSVGIGNIFFLIVAMWAASRASFSIMRITNYTLTDGRNTGKGYFSERFRAVKTMGITIITIVISLVILAYGKLILTAIVAALGLDTAVIVESTWMWLRWLLGFAIYFFMISYNYYILPTKKVEYRKVLPGSIFASVGLLLVTWLYSRYTNSLADYDLLYGALSSVVGIMFWFYFLAWVLCLGVLCNKVWEDTSGPVSKRTPPEQYTKG
ncbi:MAG: YihY/virulence factor BrkB family protein [Anaerovoracaceae bacterium]|nr:YihY/virulence factor BrkB family protein [Anaerovoracaceae bacterium]